MATEEGEIGLCAYNGGRWRNVVEHVHGADGAAPYGVVLDDKGNILGTTMEGGKYTYGVAFEITP